VGVVLALASALSYGLSDFVGGVLSKRASFIRVALAGQAGGLVVTLLAAPLASRSVPDAADLLWGSLSGVGTGVGMTFLFRGMSRGAMSVVVPVSAVGGVALPVLVGTAVLGEHLTALTWVGIGLAVPALWLVSRGDGGSSHHPTPAIMDSLLAGVGIAVQYLALAQATPAAGIWPVAAGRVAALVAVGAAALAVRTPLSTDHRKHAAAQGRRVDLGAAGAGALAACALVCYLFATRTEFVAIAVVLSSLYPVVPVVLGLLVLHEKLTPTRALGLVGAFAASVLIATAS
jgi:drug/metabolite transporter (DMT)-like permease